MWNKGRYNWNILKLETQETQKTHSQDHCWVEIWSWPRWPSQFTPIPYFSITSHTSHTSSMCQPECHNVFNLARMGTQLWMRIQASRLCSWMSGRHGRLWLSVSRGRMCRCSADVTLMELSQYVLNFGRSSRRWTSFHAFAQLALLPSFHCVYCESFFVWLVLKWLYILLKSRSRSAKTISVFVGFFDFILCPEAVVVLQICLLRLYYVLKRCVHSNNFEETQTV